MKASATFRGKTYGSVDSRWCQVFADRLGRRSLHNPGTPASTVVLAQTPKLRPL